ncbi:MAG TPA: hypothetical protein DDW89_07335 [Gammaproteobacteria bacterium]|nr:hypothetical protein [Gammaproteobacteria bacterium]
MLVAGDELGRTQQGNNNAYCQDNEITWLDWALDGKGESLLEFVKMLTRLRHRYHILRRSRFLTGAYSEELGIKDVTWINAAGGEMQVEHWDDGAMKCFGAVLDGRAQVTGIRQRGHDATLLMVFNAHYEPVVFHLPEVAGGIAWQRMIDTHLPPCEQIRADFVFGKSYQVTARSFLLFELMGHDSYATARSAQGHAALDLSRRKSGASFKPG